MNLYMSQQQLPKCSSIKTIFTQFINMWEMGKVVYLWKRGYIIWPDLRAQDEELINKSISENHKHLAKSLKNKISSACTKKKKKKTQSTEMNQNEFIQVTTTVTKMFLN